ncbi:MAG: hypothetical protein WBG80_02820, partial [Bacteroidota bacterium]
MHSSEPQPDHTPQLLGTMSFRRIAGSPARYRGDLPDIPEGETLVHLIFDAREFPVQPYCRYAKLRPGAELRTFANLEFSSVSPGRRVGPWPGWRDIPTMPEALLRRGSESREVRFQFWGDEERSGHLRGICQLPPASDPEVAVEIQDPRLMPISAELYSISCPRVVPLPTKLQRHLIDQHPRLLVSPADLPLLRQKRSGSGAAAWHALQRLLHSWDMPPSLRPGSRTPSGPELLRGEDKVLVASLINLVHPTPENTGRARESFLAYLVQTQAPDYEPLRIDTQAGETLFILCVGFDWLFDHLSAEEREQAREWLFAVADRCWSYLGYERRDYAQAHFLGCALGVLAFSFIFWEEHPRSEEWAEYFAGVLQVVLAMLPADGFYPHGINLWIYEYGFLLRWMEILRVCAGRDLWSVSPHWLNASRFRMSVTSGDGLLAPTFGDPQYRVSGDAWL